METELDIAESKINVAVHKVLEEVSGCKYLWDNLLKCTVDTVLERMGIIDRGTTQRVLEVVK